MAPKFLKDLRDKCNFPHELTAIKNHYEFDQQHSIDDIDAINKYLGNDIPETFAIEILNHFSNLLCDFVNSFCENESFTDQVSC